MCWATRTKAAPRALGMVVIVALTHSRPLSRICSGRASRLDETNERAAQRRTDVWAKISSGARLPTVTLYFFLPMYGTLDFSLRMKRGELSLQKTYQIVFSDPAFLGRASATRPSWRSSPS